MHSLHVNARTLYIARVPGGLSLAAGMPVSDKLRLFTDYVVNFDTTHRNPKWVLEHISKKTVVGDGNR